MAIAFDAASSDAAGALSWSHTCTGTDRILIVGTSIRAGGVPTESVTGITYGGQALTKVNHRDHSVGADTRTELWYKIAPLTGANTVAVTFSATPTRASGGAMSFTGVDQTTGVEANNTAEGDSTTASVTVTTLTDNAWVVASVGSRAATANSPLGGAVETWDVSAGTSHRGSGLYIGPKTPAGGQVISATVGNAEWTIVGGALKPAGGGGGPTAHNLSLLGVGQ